MSSDPFIIATNAEKKLNWSMKEMLFYSTYTKVDDCSGFFYLESVWSLSVSSVCVNSESCHLHWF